MFHRYAITTALVASMACSGLMVGCESLPGDEKTQGAVIGGVGGALAGAALGGKENRLLGALIGGAAGAGGGYLIGANWDKITGKKSDEAKEAANRAERSPATPDDVRDARTADLNDDGFVTLDEVVAMEKANLSDQESYLKDHGVSQRVVLAMRDIRPPEAARRASDTSSDTSGRERISNDSY
jgi:hypothetical protein